MKSLKILSLSLLSLLCIGQSDLQAGHGGAVAGGLLGGAILGSAIGAASRHNYYDDGYYYRHHPRYYRDGYYYSQPRRYSDEYYYSDNYDESDERRTALEEENALLRKQLRADKEKQHEKSVHKTISETTKK